jgi:EmrB/QacA subfamily drug resistance transporter
MAATGMSIFLATVDGSIVNIALPTMAQELGADFATIEWVVLAYLLTMATLLLSMGRLADMRGKKPIFTAGLVIFTIGSVLCGLAPSVWWLIGSRVVQAVGASMSLAVGMAIVTESFPPNERGRALGISGTIVSLGSITGPTLGGLIISLVGWHWIFFVNLPVGIIAVYMAIRFIPALKPRGGQRFDFAGAGAMFTSLLSFLLALTIGQHVGFGNPFIVALFALALTTAAVFLSIERRVAQPMIDLRMFKNVLFSVNLVTGLITFLAASGVFLLMPFFMGGVLGFSTGEMGLVLTIVPITMGIMSPISGTLSDRFGTRPMTVIGLALLVLTYIGFSTLTAETTVLGLMARYIPLGLGMGIFQSPNNSAIMGATPKERLGVASGLLSLTRTLGMTMGAALFAALWAGNVLVRVGAPLPDGAIGAPPLIQVAALNDTFHIVIVLVAIGLGLAAWALWQERRQRHASVDVVGAAATTEPAAE